MIAYSDLLRVSLRQVTRQKSYGVVFSIALGITAFIALAVLGQQIRYKVGQDMVLMGGVNVMRVFMEDSQYPGQPKRVFQQQSIDAIRQLKGVTSVSVSSRNAQWFNLHAADSERTVGTLFYGVDDLFVPTFSVEMVAGKPLSREDIDNHRRVVMIGREAANKIFGSPEKAMGQLLFLGVDVFEIKGVITGVMLGDWSEAGFIPVTTLIDRNWGDGGITRLFVRTQQDQLSRLQVTFMWVQVLLWLGIAASLMLGGFGIWYGTFAAVRARTREVGLKKAMGGSDGDILAQFLCEALCKSVAGGLIGIVLGVASVLVGVHMLGTPLPVLQLVLSCIGSILFSALIGIAGGIFPAVQASRMDVVTALRFE